MEEGLCGISYVCVLFYSLILCTIRHLSCLHIMHLILRHFTVMSCKLIWHSKTVIQIQWPSLNATAKEQTEKALLYQYTPPLAKLAGPNAGCYLNEDHPLEPDLPDLFWGSNYPRLLKIKKDVDPNDVFWCSACVGRERLVEVGDKLCRV